eukprot:CAMPEP_0170135970 /NCGR_PEP_ID=MMETSP0033_2-20121228/2872_1 /TAXON_ID=195969 /ORGANISM="Dolichomastix tenuilepis, Strain CCMP3274" /LENGTH=93 /DNA_ID=CAMNT_0010371619 /DNA_START=350 /DNA_END=628 /DNA_ORIENTATION=-
MKLGTEHPNAVAHHHVVVLEHAMPERGAACEQGGARRAAQRTRSLRRPEHNPLARHRVERRRHVAWRAVSPEFVAAEVIGDHEHDVWWPPRNR